MGVKKPGKACCGPAWQGKYFFFEKKKQETFDSSFLPLTRRNGDGA
jgi:hypothetical protein